MTSSSLNPPDDAATDAVDDAMTKLRAAVEQQLGVERPEHLDVEPAACQRFSPELPEALDPERRAALLARVEELQPWLQGPFWLGGDLVIGGAWRNDQRWLGLQHQVPESLAGKRVLDVGSNAGYDPFMFHTLGATEILACEPFEFIEQARFLEDVYRSGVDFQPLKWEDLDPDRHGRFDLVHCHGVLYHELHPMAMLDRLRAMLADDGTLLFGSMMLGDPELSEYARFVPGAYYGDPTWWWVPGRLCMRWMLEAAGLEVIEEFGLHDGPPGEFPVVNGYFKARQAPA
jgi:2-polyprenyl-3-methyl-5-hydroxy-6-metoxy-1,4-benzoquinol methylase